MIVAYSDFLLSQAEVARIKDSYVRNKIDEYIKAHGVQPPTLDDFYNVPDEIMESYKRTQYARYFADEYTSNQPIYQMGDIIYRTKYGEIKNCRYTDYVSGMGQAEAVVVIPDKFLPDGRARMMAALAPNENGVGSSGQSWIVWGGYKITGGSGTTEDPYTYDYYDVYGLTNYQTCPTWDNVIGGTTGSNSYGYLPSDRFANETGAVQCATDPEAYYHNDGTSVMSPMIQSPFNSGVLATSYYSVMSGNNCLSDFNGTKNTDVLMHEDPEALGFQPFKAARACRLFGTTSFPAGTWYLPAEGELGFIVARYNLINAALTRINTVDGSGHAALLSGTYYWSSSECSKTYARTVYTNHGHVIYNIKYRTIVPRPFALL